MKTGILYFTTCFHGFAILRHVDPFVRMLHIYYSYESLLFHIFCCDILHPIWWRIQSYSYKSSLILRNPVLFLQIQPYSYESSLNLTNPALFFSKLLILNWYGDKCIYKTCQLNWDPRVHGGLPYCETNAISWKSGWPTTIRPPPRCQVDIFLLQKHVVLPNKDIK